MRATWRSVYIDVNGSRQAPTWDDDSDMLAWGRRKGYHIDVDVYPLYKGDGSGGGGGYEAVIQRFREQVETEQAPPSKKRSRSNGGRTMLTLDGGSKRSRK